jgi:hypothetical protein
VIFLSRIESIKKISELNMSRVESSTWEAYFSQKIRYRCENRDIEFNIYISLPIDEIRGNEI